MVYHTGDVLIPSEGTDDSGPVRERDVVVCGRREQSTQKSVYGFQDHSTLATSVRTDVQLGDVRHIVADTLEERGRPRVKVLGTEERAQLQLLHLTGVCVSDRTPEKETGRSATRTLPRGVRKVCVGL